LGEHIETRESCRRLALLQGELGADPAEERPIGTLERWLTCDEREALLDDDRLIAVERGTGWRKRLPMPSGVARNVRS